MKWKVLCMIATITIWLGVMSTNWAEESSKYQAKDHEAFREVMDVLQINFNVTQIEENEDKLKSFLSRFPESFLIPDVKCLLAWQKCYKVTEYYMEEDKRKAWVEEILEISQEIIDKYSERKPHPLLIILWEEKKVSYLLDVLLDQIYGPQVSWWKVWYPDILSLEEIPLAQEIKEIPYGALAHFIRAEIYKCECQREVFIKKHGRDLRYPSLPRYFSPEKLAEFQEETTNEYREMIEKCSGLAGITAAAKYYLGASLVLYAEGEENYAQGISVWKDLIKELEQQSLQSPHETIQEKIATLLIYQRIYFLLEEREAELEWLRESIVAITCPDDYFLWTRANNDDWVLGSNIWPTTFDHPVITFSIEESFPENIATIIVEAFKEWEIASERRIRFRQLPFRTLYLDRRERYDLGWQPDFVIYVWEQKLALREYVGSCRQRVVYPNLNGIEIAIPPDYFELPPEVLRGTFLHKIGWRLGLLNYSYDSQDIMYKPINPSSGSFCLSQRDINTIRLLYDYRGFIPGYPPADVNQDGKIDLSDLALVGKHFGINAPPPKENWDYYLEFRKYNPDVNGDMHVDGLDLALVNEHLEQNSAKGGWQIAVKDLPALREICQMLEGMPQKDVDVLRTLEVLRKLIAFAEKQAVPAITTLLQNYPNPFNPETWIPYQIAEDAEVKIKIFGSNGKLVRTLNIGRKPAGTYLSKEKAAYWDGLNENGEIATSGVYFYTFHAGDFTAIEKMIIIK